ncbi:DUF6691 family protein [Albidovulum marisflavi]|uniref:DUF6691 family protein n=1 Tax=Albidovulum marisflavi TaxID=2984159 RepID=UPI0029828E38|nr:DUF6691 family protein [Defluviimonas sp. WL0002]
MTDTTKVIGWRDVFGNWNPTLAFVLAAAIIPMAIAWRIAPRRRSPMSGGALTPPPPPPPSARPTRPLSSARFSSASAGALRAFAQALR